MSSLFIRADATPHMGSGHIMRCRALAAAARTLGVSVVMGGRCSVPWLRPVLEHDGFTLFPDSVPKQESASSLVKQLRHMGAHPGDAIVLDGYHFGPECHIAVRALSYRLLVVDDYAHLPFYDCDILLNQNPDAESLSYKGRPNIFLTGLNYALLRPEFADPPVRVGDARDILISLGGGNFLQHLEDLAPALTTPCLHGRALKVIAGSMKTDAIVHVLRQCPARVEILPRVDNMPALLAATSVCISAGGSTCWELCRMGVPFLTVEVAENQHGIVNWLDQTGVAPYFSGESLECLLRDDAFRSTVSARCRSLVDGQGATRVAKALLS